MPAVIVHDTFALEMIPEDEKPYIAAVRSGTQGPDLFMAYGKNPFKKREDAKEIRPWGTVMHHTPVEDVYGKMMEYANTKEAGEKELLYAYIDGLLMHFSVDRVCHPYVFYRTGFDEKGGTAEVIYGVLSGAPGAVTMLFANKFIDRVGGMKKTLILFILLWLIIRWISLVIFVAVRDADSASILVG